MKHDNTYATCLHNPDKRYLASSSFQVAGFALGIRELTVKERILLHLFDFNRFADEFEVPEGVTQGGIAGAVGIRVQHVTQYVRPLLSEGLVEVSTRHIQQKPRRQKAYFLTPNGRHSVASQRGTLLQEKIPFRSIGGEVENLPLSHVYLEERRGMSLVDLLAEASATGCVTEVIDPSVSGVVDFSQDAPAVTGFYGREDEIREVVDALDLVPMVVVTGIAGIGKTTLGSKVCEVFRGERSLLWRRIRPWEGAFDLTFHVASFLKVLGRPRLHNYLDDSAPKDLGRVEKILASDVTGVEGLIVLDDAHTASENAEAFLSILFDVLRRTGETRILLLSRTVPGFYSRRDVEIDGSLVEHSLEGLDEASGRAILGDAGIPESEVTGLLELAGGNPLFLNLLAKAAPRTGMEGGWKTLETYIAEEIEPSMTAEERGCLQIASFYELPVSAGGLLLEQGIGTRTLVSLQKKGFLGEVDGRRFVLHDFLRSYFQSGLSSARKSSLAPVIARWLRKEAHAREVAGSPRRGIDLLENALSIGDTPRGRLTSLERLGDLRLKAEGLQGAVGPYEKALDEAEDVFVQARLRERLAFCYSSLNRADEALEMMKEGLRQLPEGPSVEAGRLLTLKAAWNFFMREYEEARDLLEKVLGWRDRFPKAHHLWTRAFRYRGWLHLQVYGSRDLAKAQADLEAALNSALAQSDKPVGVREAYADLASVAFDQGRVEAGFEYLAKGIEAMEIAGIERGTALAAPTAWFLSECVGDYEAAEDAYERAFDGAKKWGNLGWQVPLHRSLAFLYWHQGRVEEAKEAMTHFLKREDEVWGTERKTSRHLQNRIGNLAFLVRYCLASGDEDLAITSLRKLRNLVQADPSDMDTFFSRWAEGMLHFHGKDFAAARASYEQAHRFVDEADRWELLQLFPCTGIIGNEFLLDYGRLLAAMSLDKEARSVFSKILEEAKLISRAPLVQAAEEELRAIGEPA